MVKIDIIQIIFHNFYNIDYLTILLLLLSGISILILIIGFFLKNKFNNKIILQKQTLEIMSILIPSV